MWYTMDRMINLNLTIGEEIMINKIPELKRLELNKENVMKIMFEMRATPESKRKTESTFYSKSSIRKAPPVLFDSEKIFDYYSTISYLLGQIKGVHEGKVHLTPAEGIFNYKGEKWTDDNRALFALYYLGSVTSTFPRFIDGEKSAMTPPMKSFYEGNLIPTFAPSDSRFNLKDARNALKEFGVKLPVDLTHYFDL